MIAKKARMKIGAFETDKEGVIRGRIGGFGFSTTDVVLQPAVSAEGEDYLKIITDPILDAFQVGAAFEKQIVKDGKTIDYHSVTLDSPMFPRAINAALFPSREYAGHYNLMWSRYEPPLKLDAKAEATAEVPATGVTAPDAKKAGPNGKAPGKPGGKRRDTSLHAAP